MHEVSITPLKLVFHTLIRKRVNCEVLQLQGRPMSRQLFSALITRCIMHQPTNSTLPQSRFRFDKPDIIQDSSNSVIRWHFQVFLHCTDRKTAIILFQSILPNDLRTFITCCTQHWNNFHQVRCQATYLFLNYNAFTADMLLHTVTLTSDVMTLNVCRVFRGFLLEWQKPISGLLAP